MKRVFLSSLSLLTLLAAAPSARAEAGLPPLRCATFAAPSFGAPVPSNVLALTVRDVSAASLEAAIDSAEVIGVSTRLPTPGLTRVADPRSPHTTLLVLDGELAPKNAYAFKYGYSCTGSGGKTPALDHGTGDAAFGTSGHVALPTQSGTIAVGADAPGTNFTPLTLTPSAELAAYLAVTLVDFVVDGEVWAQLPYGSLAIENDVVALNVSGYNVTGSVGQAITGKAPLCVANENVIKSKRFELRPHVAGATTDPAPITVDVPLDCVVQPPVQDRVDAGVPSDAGYDQPGVAPPSDGGEHSGCEIASASHGPGSVPFGLGLVVGTVAALVRRSKRKAE
jgi:hypothetical protein